jgi:photosystem II stability/assembly factor-like uncharacterized protein
VQWVCVGGGTLNESMQDAQGNVGGAQQQPCNGSQRVDDYEGTCVGDVVTLSVTADPGAQWAFQAISQDIGRSPGPCGTAPPSM